jgi:hypothetical protein
MIQTTQNAPSKHIFAAAPAHPVESGWPIGSSVNAHEALFRVSFSAAIYSIIASNRLEAR